MLLLANLLAFALETIFFTAGVIITLKKNSLTRSILD